MVRSTTGLEQDMTRQQQIDEICHTIIREFDPDKLVLFGSEARGCARPDSDIDLLVVMPFSGSSVKQATKIYGSIDRRRIAVDLLVRTSEQLRERDRIGDVFFREVMSTGKVIHERTHA